MLRVQLLGTGAGGGLPQWNCSCTNCMNARLKTISSRTQCNISVTQDDLHYLLVNCSPDILQQLKSYSNLYPSSDHLRNTPIKSVILTGADIDQILGLLSLREFTAFTIYSTAPILEVIQNNLLFASLLKHVVLYPVAIGTEILLSDNLRFTLNSVPGVEPNYIRSTSRPQATDPFTLSVSITDGAKSLWFAPSIGELDDLTLEHISRHDLILFDGTFYTNDELLKTIGEDKKALEIGHLPMLQSFPLLSSVCSRLKYIHINNTNPVNDPVFLNSESIIPTQSISSDGEQFLL